MTTCCARMIQGMYYRTTYCPRVRQPPGSPQTPARFFLQAAPPNKLLEKLQSSCSSKQPTGKTPAYLLFLKDPKLRRHTRRVRSIFVRGPRGHKHGLPEGTAALPRLKDALALIPSQAKRRGGNVLATARHPHPACRPVEMSIGLLDRLSHLDRAALGEGQIG